MFSSVHIKVAIYSVSEYFPKSVYWKNKMFTLFSTITYHRQTEDEHPIATNNNGHSKACTILLVYTKIAWRPYRYSGIWPILLVSILLLKKQTCTGYIKSKLFNIRSTIQIDSMFDNSTHFFVFIEITRVAMGKRIGLCVWVTSNVSSLRAATRTTIVESAIVLWEDAAVPDPSCSTTPRARHGSGLEAAGWTTPWRASWQTSRIWEQRPPAPAPSCSATDTSRDGKTNHATGMVAAKAHVVWARRFRPASPDCTVEPWRASGRCSGARGLLDEPCLRVLTWPEEDVKPSRRTGHLHGRRSGSGVLVRAEHLEHAKPVSATAAGRRGRWRWCQPTSGGWPGIGFSQTRLGILRAPAPTCIHWIFADAPWNSAGAAPLLLTRAQNRLWDLLHTQVLRPLPLVYIPSCLLSFYSCLPLFGCASDNHHAECSLYTWMQGSVEAHRTETALCISESAFFFDLFRQPNDIRIIWKFYRIKV